MASKKYTWYPCNNNSFKLMNVYSSIDECINDAQNKYDKHVEEYDESNIEKNSSIITIGEIEYFSTKNSLVNIFENFDELISSYVDDFAIHTDCDFECYFDDEKRLDFANEAANAILPIVNKYLYVYPTMKAHTICRYDLKEKQIYNL